MKQIVRIINADIPGNKQIYTALRYITGVSYSFSNAVLIVLDIDKHKKVGDLTDEEIKKIEDAIKNPQKYNIPFYLYNRKKDPETGENKHIITSALKLQTEIDIKKLKRIKSYRGIRHALGLPTRGQKTKGHFRHGRTIGVSKKKMAPAKKA